MYVYTGIRGCLCVVGAPDATFLGHDKGIGDVSCLWYHEIVSCLSKRNVVSQTGLRAKRAFADDTKLRQAPQDLASLDDKLLTFALACHRCWRFSRRGAVLCGRTWRVRQRELALPFAARRRAS